MKLIKVATAALNQTPLDWENNKRNILSAIDQAKQRHATVLCLPELCTTGYGCEDQFLSRGLQERALHVLREIAPYSVGLVVSVGLPVLYSTQVYNCSCLLVNGEIQGFAAKHFLAGAGIHYEPRWFSPWPVGTRGQIVLDGKRYAIGDLIFDCGDVRIGFEICEDAWSASRPGIELAKEGANVILNPSASHFAFGKFDVRRRFILEGSRAFGVVYVYSNLLGNEAGRVIYDGGEMIASAGEIAAVGERFSFKECSVSVSVVDLDRNALPHQYSAVAESGVSESHRVYHTLKSPFAFPELEPEKAGVSFASWEESKDLKEEEFSRAVSLGLFDYLRKTRAYGFVVSLSGGADSSSIACLVALMVRFGLRELGSEQFIQRLGYIPAWKGRATVCEREIVEALLTCVYQATKNSSVTTLNAAKGLAEAVGAAFFQFDVDELVEGYTRMVSQALNEELSWEEHDLSLQNIQARTRGPLVWFIANVKNALLLATSNRSEAAVGYTTMDGDTCGGLSPIAGIDKAFIRHWLCWLEKGELTGGEKLPQLALVTAQEPTAELRPTGCGQTDEQDLMPYSVLDLIERSAIRDRKVPLEVLKLIAVEFPQFDKAQLGFWVKRFFRLWSRNQWKRERYAPSFHLDDENLDPKTWCRFPILSGGFEVELRELDEYLSQPNGK